MTKTIFKLLLSAFVYTIVFVLASAILPYSDGFRELGASGNPMDLLFMLVNSAWVCFTLYFIIRHTNYKKKQLFFSLLGMMFFVVYFMTQIETLLFANAFSGITKNDILFIMLTGLFPLSVTILLLLRFFKNKGAVTANEAAVKDIIDLSIKSTFLKLGLIGVIYLCVYMVFGYFIAWQYEELRIFYSGSAEKLHFWQQVFSNSPGMMLFQVLRGLLFGAFIIPLRLMITKSKTVFVTSVCLVYLCTALLLIVPNALFPDMVRIAHLIEMTGSMLLFGMIVGNIMHSMMETQ